MDSLQAFVSFPDAPFTEELVKKALARLDQRIGILDQLPQRRANESQDPRVVKLLQWCTYDVMSHELSLKHPTTVLSSSYVIRKSLIRKHYLHRTIQEYLAKHPASPLGASVPRTWDIDISHADEIDELWVDDLYDLAMLTSEEHLSSAVEEENWFILKPGMADRGMGIRMFKSKDGLQRIFESFEEEDEEEGEVDDEQMGNSTGIATSQLRHFVIQEYLASPVLVDPRQTLGLNLTTGWTGRKFHLRAYCVAQGALSVYLCPRILALFSSSAYTPPTADLEASSDLSAHLTNTSLQESHGEENVRLLQELVGCNILHSLGRGDTEVLMTQAHIDSIVDQVATCIGEVFKAALNSPVHFQTLPNSFELFGADLLLTWPEASPETPVFRVHLLELNAEPAIHLTGPRLSWILDELFGQMTDTCVKPFFGESEGVERDAGSAANEEGRLKKCLDVRVRGAGAW